MGRRAVSPVSLWGGQRHEAARSGWATAPPLGSNGAPTPGRAGRRERRRGTSRSGRRGLGLRGRAPQLTGRRPGVVWAVVVVGGWEWNWGGSREERAGWGSGGAAPSNHLRRQRGAGEALAQPGSGGSGGAQARCRSAARGRPLRGRSPPRAGRSVRRHPTIGTVCREGIQRERRARDVPVDLLERRALAGASRPVVPASEARTGSRGLSAPGERPEGNALWPGGPGRGTPWAV
jgi:hypothetical protein